MGTRIPKGLRLKAQGCEERATLGKNGKPKSLRAESPSCDSLGWSEAQAQVKRPKVFPEACKAGIARPRATARPCHHFVTTDGPRTAKRQPKPDSNAASESDEREGVERIDHGLR